MNANITKKQIFHKNAEITDLTRKIKKVHFI